MSRRSAIRGKRTHTHAGETSHCHDTTNIEIAEMFYVCGQNPDLLVSVAKSRVY